MTTIRCGATGTVIEPPELRVARRRTINAYLLVALSARPQTVRELRDAAPDIPVQWVSRHVSPDGGIQCGGHLSDVAWHKPLCEEIRRELQRLERAGVVIHLAGPGQAHLWAWT